MALNEEERSLFDLEHAAAMEAVGDLRATDTLDNIVDRVLTAGIWARKEYSLVGRESTESGEQ